MDHHIFNAVHMPDSTRCLRQLCLLLLGYALIACSSLDSASKTVVGAVSPYKIDIVQGNFVSAEQLAAVKPGMNRAQVREILGTPLLASVFHADRWDYVFTFRRQGQVAQSRSLSVFFKAEVLVRIEADPMPTEAEFVATLDSGRRLGKVPVLEAPPAPAQPGAAAKPPEAKAQAPLPSTYPRLEPATP